MKALDIPFKKVDNSTLIEDLKKGLFTAPSSKEFSILFKKLDSATSSGDYLTSRNCLTVLVFFNTDKTFESIKRKGVFRYSKYTNRKCIVKNLSLDLIDICRKLNKLTPSFEIYLNSIVTYSTIVDSYKSFDKYILNEIRAFEKKYAGKSLVKTLLSAVDFLFLSNYEPNSTDDLSSISSRTKEEVSSAVSFLIYFYTERIKGSNIDTTFVAEDYIKSGEIDKLIIPACYHLDFREFEILIDHFDYECVMEDARMLIRPPFEDFEKAIRLGYIRTDIQQMNDRIIDHEALSFENLVDELNKQDSFKFFTLTDTHNYERYRVEMPEPIFEILIDKFIKPDALFREEISYLSMIFKEQLLDIDDLKKIKLKDDLTLEEFMKIRRVFMIFYLLFAKEIYKKEKVETNCLLRSLIPSFPEKTFREFIEKLLPANKIDSFLDLVSWEPGLEIVFDLQYHPILFFDDHFLIPLSIFANSNSIRNLFASEYKQNNTELLKNGEVDPLVDKLHSSLSEASLLSFSQTPIGFSDLDVFAVHENVLFVFECKHSLHPVSPFDLRTTFDYIKKAENQLDLVLNDFHNGHLVKKLEAKHNIKLNGIEKIQGVIVLSNRLFNGNIFKYPVRNISEIDNMLNQGTMKTKDGTFWLWKEKKLTIDFLLDYFSLDNNLILLLSNSLSQRTQIYEFAKPEIKFNTYFLDIEIATSKLKEFSDTLEIKTDEEGSIM